MLKNPLEKNVKEYLKEVESKINELIINDNKTINDASKQILNAGGKRLRPALAYICAGKENKDKLNYVAVAVEFIHMASLIHDDLIDKTNSRRGKPTINNTYDEETAIRIGDYIFAKAFKEIARTENGEVIEILSKSAVDLTLGELLQQKTAFEPKQSESLYMMKIKFKTASLFEATCKMAAIIGGKDEKETESYAIFGQNLGFAFQIFDDVMDITGDSDEMGKPKGSDLIDGVVTMPYLIALEDSSKKELLNSAIMNKNIKKDEIEDVLRAVEESKAIDKTKQKANQFIDYAIKALDTIKEEESVKQLKKIASFVVDRYH